MNGEAITKRYEVKDLETGEILKEPFYVLRPRSDQAASTAMFAYAALCGIEDHEWLWTIGNPPEDAEYWRRPG